MTPEVTEKMRAVYTLLGLENPDLFAAKQVLKMATDPDWQRIRTADKILEDIWQGRGTGKTTRVAVAAIAGLIEGMPAVYMKSGHPARQSHLVEMTRTLAHRLGIDGTRVQSATHPKAVFERTFYDED